MNKNLLLGFFSLFFCLSNIFGQSWYPLGAQWYFDQQMLLDYPAHGYTKYTVESDTLIALKHAKKIISRSYNFHNGNEGQVTPFFMLEENSKVFRWTGSEYKLIYDFTLSPGDTLAMEVINLDCDSITPIIIDSIGMIDIMGKSLNVQYISYTEYWPFGYPNSYKIHDMIFERVGRTEEFNYTPVCGFDSAPWENLQLRCYNDTDISFKSDWWFQYFHDAPCDTLIDGSTSIITDNLSGQIMIYPNPCRNELNIIHPTSAIKNVLLYNSVGLLINSYEPNNVFIKLNIETFVSGIYYVHIITEKQLETRIIVKF